MTKPTSQTHADASAKSIAHTPAPWTFTETGVYGPTLNAHGNFYICALPFPSEEPSEQEAANLRLISASPDMLDALKVARLNISSLLASKHPAVFGAWLEEIEAVIAKAEGSK